MKKSESEISADAPIVEAVAPVGAAPSASLGDANASPVDDRLVLCGRDGQVVALVPYDYAPPFRVTHDAVVYEHTGEDSMGRWVYRASA